MSGPARSQACQEYLNWVTVWNVLPSVLPWAAADNKVARDKTKETVHMGANPSHLYIPGHLKFWINCT